MTYDEMALRLIIAGDERGLERLHRQARIATGRLCPECGGADGIEDNGERGRYLTFLCPCGHQWDAVPV